jgi:hypothetical protein
MWTRRIPPDECARACEWASLRLDSQLSDFESVLLEAHLARCLGCRAFDESLTGMTETLRAAPLEEVSFAIQLPRRSGVRMHALRLVSAAAVAAIVGLSGLVGLELSADQAPSAVAHFDPAVMELKERQLAALGSSGQRTPTVRPGLAAAEGLTVGGAVGVTARRFARATKRLPANG